MQILQKNMMEAKKHNGIEKKLLFIINNYYEIYTYNINM
jgi:hypothetical protein